MLKTSGIGQVEGRSKTSVVFILLMEINSIFSLDLCAVRSRPVQSWALYLIKYLETVVIFRGVGSLGVTTLSFAGDRRPADLVFPQLVIAIWSLMAQLV